MKFNSNFKIFLSLVILYIMINSIITNKTNLRSKGKRAYEPRSYTKKELEMVRDFDDFSEKVEHLSSTNYFDILKLGAGIKGSTTNMKNSNHGSKNYRFTEKNTVQSNNNNKFRSRTYTYANEIPMANLKHPELIYPDKVTTYTGVN